MKHDHTHPGDLNLAPGAARCPGPSAQDIVRAEDSVRHTALTDEHYEFLGDTDIAFSRYTSPEFFDLEIEKMWSKTWQWACREEHIANAGDYHVYDIGPYSVIVVRCDDGAAADSIKAFVNSCPHRGMQFCDAGSSGSGKQFLRCPFHGMSWHLDGSLREIPCRWDFPHVNEEHFRLTQVQCDTWGGFVFINLDRDAQALHDYLEILPEHFRDWPLQDRYVALHMEKVLPGNWKMCMEGFMEAYHVLATHPEGLKTSGWANTQYDIFGSNVTRFLQPRAIPSPHFGKGVSEREAFEFMGHDPEDLPAGVSARQGHADILRRTMGKQLGVDLSGYSNSQMLDSIEYHVFPNACIFPGISVPFVYRFRPLSIDTCIHEILVLHPVPENAPRPAPAKPIKLGIDDSYTTVDGFKENRLAMVLDQDTANFKRQRAGIKAATKTGQTLGNYQESRIRRFHMTLDEYLAPQAAP
jgi:phenylpropionate dioxygenase-like ring-hydroxylating dioxygenase large terminal subunit